MNIEDRKRIAKEELLQFLSIYSPPRGLGDDQLADRIAFTADAFARRMPTTGDFREQVQRVFSSIRDTHISNTWPAQAAFVMAMPQREVMGSAPETFMPNDADLWSRRMLEGNPVPEAAIWGVVASKLPHGKLDQYRTAAASAWVNVYGSDAHNKMRAKYGAVVDPYFSQATKRGGQ